MTFLKPICIILILSVTFNQIDSYQSSKGSYTGGLITVEWTDNQNTSSFTILAPAKSI